MDVGVIGTGNMGRNHVRVYSELKGIDEVMVYDVNRDGARSIAEKNSAVVADSLDELLHSVDAASICVPTEYHFDIARKGISKGVHLLIEKPVCRTTREAEQLEDACRDDLVIGVGHIERFNPIINEISRIFKKPLYVEIKRHNPASARVTGSTVVEDLMIHDIDIVFHRLFGGPYSLRCSGNHDICGALFDFQGIPVYLSASRKSSKKIRMIYIEEEDCTIEGDFMSQEVYVHRKPGQYAIENDRYVQENIIEKVMVNKLEPLKVELETFLESIRSDTPFPVTLAQAKTNLSVCEEILGACRV
jgi:predicted dehydrogenase